MKLNKEIRQGIIKAAMAKTGLIEEYRALVKDYADWAEGVRRLVNGVSDADIQKAINKFNAAVPAALRNQLVNTECYLLLVMPGVGRFKAWLSGYGAKNTNALTYLNVEWKDIGETIEKEVYAPRNYTPFQVTDGDLIHAYELLEHRLSELVDKAATANSYVSGYVHSVTTVERLIEVWPEVAPLIPKQAAPAPVAGLPSIPRDSLNAMFHLP